MTSSKKKQPLKMRRKNKKQVVIIGAGVAGLMLALKLTEEGIEVVLIEKSIDMAAGASTKNEGWVHPGTYHAVSIKDRQTAMQVAARCIYGHEAIRRYVPQAIEEPDMKSFAVTFDKDTVDEITSRWDEANVKYKPVSLRMIERLVPEGNVEKIEAAFEVADVAVNTPMFYRKLVHDLERAGVVILNEATIHFPEQDAAIVQQAGRDAIELEADYFIYATGYGTKEFVRSEFGIELPMRFWKSHLLTVKRLTRHSLFCLDAGEAALINHGEFSMIGRNEDAVQVSVPDTNVMSDKVADSLSAVQRLFNKEIGTNYLATACIKVDMPLGSSVGRARSLNIAVYEFAPKHIVMLPGKMTEAPYVTDAVTQMLYGALSDGRVAERPLDTWAKEWKSA